MNTEKIAGRIAKSIMAGTGSHEFEQQIDAINSIQEFVEEEALSWAALQGRMSQSALRRASRALATARKELYDAWDKRDKTIPV